MGQIVAVFHSDHIYQCSSARYNTHLYRLAVQAGFYSDAIECWISTQETLVQSSVWAKRLFASFSPVTFGAQRGALLKLLDF